MDADSVIATITRVTLRSLLSASNLPTDTLERTRRNALLVDLAIARSESPISRHRLSTSRPPSLRNNHFKSSAMPHHATKPPASRGLVTGVVVFYLFAALSMVMANKWVLNTTSAPLFFLWTQLMIAVLLFGISDATRVLPDRLTLDINICKGLIPMVGLNVVGLSFSNYTLKYVDASFYQVARGLVLPFTVVTSFVVLHSRPSLRILLSCAVVTLGFFIGVFLDGTPISMIGIFFGVASSGITAMHSVVIKQSLEVVNGSALLLSWYTNLISAIVLLPICLLAGEGPGVLKLLSGDVVLAPDGGMSPLRTFMWGSLITGALGFLMSIASLLSIKVTSPITHMVSSAVRGVAASLLGMWLFHDIITSGRATSIAVILFGSFYYTWVKHQETQKPAPSPGAYERVKMEDVELGAKEHKPK
ncbi:GDP-fucose transporter 1 [Hypsizygus marmoreus]|uniref:GDP-fucose transporter 1 n=1 Tax=Hypsizygus marmoreus TaxID=39966 RepID=A0A369J5L0_HYPMA|nr:GDP-fucose transporter 1 [Hypsizygus marmoreus]